MSCSSGLFLAHQPVQVRPRQFAPVRINQANGAQHADRPAVGQNNQFFARRRYVPHNFIGQPFRNGIVIFAGSLKTGIFNAGVPPIRHVGYSGGS